jgi:hypothetical protein
MATVAKNKKRGDENLIIFPSETTGPIGSFGDPLSKFSLAVPSSDQDGRRY